MKQHPDDDARFAWNADWDATFHRWDVRNCMEFALSDRGAFWIFMFNVLTAVALAAENARGVGAVKYARYS